MDTKSQTSEIVRKYMEQCGLSLRGMAKELTMGDLSWTHGSIDHWVKGISSPEYRAMKDLYQQTHPGQWQHQFAYDILRSLQPNIWK